MGTLFPGVKLEAGGCNEMRSLLFLSWLVSTLFRRQSWSGQCQLKNYTKQNSSNRNKKILICTDYYTVFHCVPKHCPPLRLVHGGLSSKNCPIRGMHLPWEFRHMEIHVASFCLGASHWLLYFPAPQFEYLSRCHWISILILLCRNIKLSKLDHISGWYRSILNWFLSHLVHSVACSSGLGRLSLCSLAWAGHT